MQRLTNKQGQKQPTFTEHPMRRTRLPLRKKPGPKSRLQSWMLKEVEELVGKLGARNKDLAEYFHVAESTIDYWIKNNPDFERAVRRGRLEACLKVSQALFHKATGYSHPDTVVLSNRVKEYDDEGKVISERTEPLLVPLVKHYPPDAYAAFKYLTIMFRDVWMDESKLSIQHNINADINIKKIEELSLDNLSDEVKDFLFQLNLKQLNGAQSN